MFRSKRYVSLVLGALATFGVGCGGSDTNNDGGRDGGGSGSEYVYVMNQLTIDSNSEPADGPVSGFNLDGKNSVADNTDGCGFVDFMSNLDADQSGGVDNQLPSLANSLKMFNEMFDIRANLQNAVNQSNLVVLARVSNVDNLTNDENVTVRIYVGHATFTTGCTSVTADREYVVDAASVNNNNLDDAKFQFQGKIVNGRLQAQGGNAGVLQLVLPLGGQLLPINLENAQLRMDITADGATNGNLGGAVRGQEMVDAICAFNSTLCDPAKTIVGGFTDIQSPEGVCFDMSGATPRYGSIGLGMRVGAIRAKIRGMNSVVPERPTGVCGASTTGADGGA